MSTLRNLFKRAVQDERLVAIGLCSDAGKLLSHTDGYPPDLTCLRAAHSR